MANIIYSFKDVYFKAAGKSYPVAAVTIMLQENAIPAFIIRLDPAHQVGDPSVPATLVTLQKLSELNDTAQELAKNYTKADFGFKVYEHTADGNTVLDQQFEVNAWVITSAGFVTSGDGFGYELTVMHPLAICNATSSSIGGLINTNLDKKRIPASADIPTAIVTGMRTLLNTAETTITDGFKDKNCSDGGADAVEKFRADMTKSADTLTKYLKWSPNIYALASPGINYSPWPQGWSGITSTTDAEEHMSRYLGTMFTGVYTTNVWDIIAQAILSSWMVTIVPTWWRDYLSMVPSSPWLDPYVVVDSTDIASINFPSFERNRYSGVYCVVNHGPIMADCEFVTRHNGNYADGALYRPNKELDGGLMDVSVPDWFSYLMSVLPTGRDAYELDKSGTKIAAQLEQTNMAVNDMASQKRIFDNERCVIFNYAKQVFMSAFRSASQLKLVTRLLIKSDGRYVCPGFVCRIHGDVEYDSNVRAEDLAARGDLLDFYITQVAHTIRFDQGIANTTIAGKYVRAVDGYPNIIKEKTNPVYTTQTGTP